MNVIEFNHVNVTVPAAAEAAARKFYSDLLGLRQVPKPEGSRTTVGAWYQLGPLQLHLSVEDGMENHASSRHVCYLVRDIGAAENHFRNAGVEIIPDVRPVRGWPRFYIRDPGGNLIEIAQNLREVSLESRDAG